MPTLRNAGLWVLLFGALVALKWPTLHDPPFWDGLGGYVPQGRFIAQFGTHWEAYRQLEFIRPPLFSGTLAILMSLGVGNLGLHVYSLIAGLAVLPATWVIARRLGASAGGAWVAVVACAVSPLYFAQLGLLQTDALTAALTAWAWAALLGERGWLFALLASFAVLTKESAYFVWLPAVWLGWRRTRSFWRAVLPVVPPILCAAGWLVASRFLVGSVLNENYKQNFRLDNLAASLYHDFVEGGRLVLWVCAGYAVRELRRAEVGVTAVAAALLALLFPFGLPRYMLPALPLLCAAAAVGLEAMAPTLRRVVGVLLVAGMVAGYVVPHWDTWRAHHMDASLRYRELLALEKEAAVEISRERPASVLAVFPMAAVLSAPADDGFLPAPLVVHWWREGEPLAELCRHDLIVRDTQGVSIEGAYEALAAVGALSLWRTFGEGHDTIRVYRVACLAR